MHVVASGFKKRQLIIHNINRLLMLSKLRKHLQQKKVDQKLFKEYLNNKANYEQFVDYVKFKTHLPSLHIIKQNNIYKYSKEHNFQTLVETGTYLGDMVESQLNNFKQIYSIELSENLYKDAVERFKKNNNVKIIQGDSGFILKDLVKELKEPVLFWLDGHYSAGVTAKADKDTPVLEELRSILKSEFNHGILIDDARLFIGKDDYPTIDEICSYVKKLDLKRTVEVADDIIRIMKI